MVKKLNWILLSDLKFTDAFYIFIGKCIRIRHIDLSENILILDMTECETILVRF